MRVAEASALTAQVPRRFPTFEERGGSLESLHPAALSPRAEFVRTVLVGCSAVVIFLYININQLRCSTFRFCYLYFNELFRSARCPARPAAHFRPRPGSGGGRAIYGIYMHSLFYLVYACAR